MFNTLSHTLKLSQHLSSLFPQTGCAFCHSAITGNNLPVCEQCVAELPWCNERGQTLGELSAFYYEAPVSQYILVGKTGKRLDKLHLLAALFAEQLPGQITDLPQAIIPVPLHPSRLRTRGFNQSIELVRPLANKLQIPLLTRHIIRQRETKDQKQLSAAHRRQNMHQAFSLTRPLLYRHIALFDDVITTGTTCSTLRNLLLDEGVQSVQIWCCATTRLQRKH